MVANAVSICYNFFAGEITTDRIVEMLSADGQASCALGFSYKQDNFISNRK